MNRTLLLFLILLVGSLNAQELTAKQIIANVDEKLSGSSSTYAEMKITTVRPKWTRSKMLKTWSDGKDGVILVTEPVKEKGIVFLKKGDEVWNWVPNINRMIKMPPSMMMQSWMGTDLKNDDLVQKSSLVDDYTHNLLKDTLINNNECYQIEMIPNQEALVVWGKIVICIDKKHFVQLESNFFDEDLDLISTMRASEITNYQGRFLARKMEVIPVKKNAQKTVMEYQDLKFDIAIPDGFFTVQNMKKVQ